ncbi:hypothetical protein C8R47DRAFT_1215565 [Mycena vitilis]|nr:hypothetical protein C8R47DRAFT_1215565 [Mycena vitilis]
MWARWCCVIDILGLAHALLNALRLDTLIDRTVFFKVVPDVGLGFEYLTPRLPVQAPLPPFHTLVVPSSQLVPDSSGLILKTKRCGRWSILSMCAKWWTFI